MIQSVIHWLGNMTDRQYAIYILCVFAAWWVVNYFAMKALYGEKDD